MEKLNRNLTEGRTGRHLAILTWPMLLGLLGIVVFNLVDTYFIGKLGVQQLAAMGFCFPVIMFINSIAHGVGIGTSSLIARNVVKMGNRKVRLMSSHSLMLGIILVIIFAIVGLLTIKPVFLSMGASRELLVFINEYMSIWYFGVAFVVVPMIGNSIVRATGDTFTPGMVMVFSAVMNVVLDPLLIFGIGPFPAMGMKGAALATVIARAAGVVLVLIILIYRENILTFNIGSISEVIKNWIKVLYIAGPASLAMLITPISIGLITRIISGYGKEAVAAFGVASRIETFALMVISALGSVLIIFMGQNISQKKFLRIHQALKYSGFFALGWGAIVFILILLFSDGISSIFSENTDVVKITSVYLKIVAISYGFQGLVMVSMASFNGLNKPLPATFFSFLRMLILYVPLAWVGSYFFQLSGIFWAAVISNIISGTGSYLYLFKTIKKIENR